MTRLNELQKNIELKKTYLCLGLDTDIEKIPTHLNKNSDPVFEFNKSLIDRLHNKIVATILLCNLSIKDLLNSKTGSEFLFKCVGIFSISVSNPRHK